MNHGHLHAHELEEAEKADQYVHGREDDIILVVLRRVLQVAHHSEQFLLVLRVRLSWNVGTCTCQYWPTLTLDSQNVFETMGM